METNYTQVCNSGYTIMSRNRDENSNSKLSQARLDRSRRIFNNGPIPLVKSSIFEIEIKFEWRQLPPKYGTLICG